MHRPFEYSNSEWYLALRSRANAARNRMSQPDPLDLTECNLSSFVRS